MVYVEGEYTFYFPKHVLYNMLHVEYYDVAVVNQYSNVQRRNVRKGNET